jgi:hypothetical protein
MAVFGLGTFPAMLLTGGLGTWLRYGWRLRGVRVAGAFILVLGADHTGPRRGAPGSARGPWTALVPPSPGRSAEPCAGPCAARGAPPLTAACRYSRTVRTAACRWAGVARPALDEGESRLLLLRLLAGLPGAARQRRRVGGHVAADPAWHRRLPGDEHQAAQPAVLHGPSTTATRTCCRCIHLILWALTTAMLVISPCPSPATPGTQARRGALTADTLMTLGVLAAYLYSCRRRAARRPARVLRHRGAAAGAVHPRPAAGGQRPRPCRAQPRAHARGGPPVGRCRGPDGALQRMRIARGAHRACGCASCRGSECPVDGMVLEGRSHLDESILTGEPMAPGPGTGQPVLSGSINHEGSLLIEATVAGPSGRWAQICRAVRESLSQARAVPSGSPTASPGRSCRWCCCWPWHRGPGG